MAAPGDGDFFSPDYRQARRNFLAAAEASGAAIEHLAHPGYGPGDEPLFTDVARIGPRPAEKVLALVSGTHGVEGFAGSAIQRALLRGGIEQRLGPGQALVLIHALNPFGFAHLRRVDEENVDLNRNFPDRFDPPPGNPGYDRLAAAIAPPSLSAWSEMRSRLAFLRYRLRYGGPALQLAVSRGQYTHPQGLFFGGRAPTWSHKTFREIVLRHIEGAGKAVLVDFHTGLGSFGAAEVILIEAPLSPAHSRARAWWGDRVRSTADGTSTSAAVGGTILHRLPQMLPGAELTAVVLECGTLPAKEVFLALRRENCCWHHGDRKRARGVLLPAFCPDRDDWKETVLQAGLEVARRGLDAL